MGTYRDVPLRPIFGGATGTASSETVPANVTIPAGAKGAELHVSSAARVAVTSSTTDLTVDDDTFGYVAANTVRVMTFFAAGNAAGDRQIQIACQAAASPTVYQVAFLG